MADLTDYGFVDTGIIHKDRWKIDLKGGKMTKYKKVEQKQVKFEAIADYIEGEFCSIEESSDYKGSWVVHFKNIENEPEFAFINQMGKGLIDNNIKAGEKFKLVYQGKEKTKDGKFEYKKFELFIPE